MIPHIAAHIVEIPNNTRPPLTADEEATLPRDGLPLVAADRVVGKAPPGGVIRQSKDDWWWHPNEAHAEVAAKARGELAFIVGDGVIPREIAAHV
jgi:hypothetical protein